MELRKQVKPGVLAMGFCLLSVFSQAFSADKPLKLGAMKDSHPLPVGKMLYAETDRGEKTIVSLDGRFVILGDFKIVDMWRAKEVTGVEGVKQLHRTPLVKIKEDLDKMAWFTFGNGKEEAFIFTDFSSRYNGELFPQITPELLSNYKFYVVYAPLTSDKLAVPINRSIFCSVSPNSSYKVAIDNASKPKAMIEKLTEIGLKPDCTSKKLVNSAAITNILGVTNVPTVINSHGVRLVSPKNLEDFMDEK